MQIYLISIQYVLLKMHQALYSIYIDCDHVSKLHRFIPRSQVHLTFIIQYPNQSQSII